MTHALWFRMINIFSIIPVPTLILSVWSAGARANLGRQNAGRHTHTHAHRHKKRRRRDGEEERRGRKERWKKSERRSGDGTRAFSLHANVKIWIKLQILENYALFHRRGSADVSMSRTISWQEQQTQQKADVPASMTKAHGDERRRPVLSWTLTAPTAELLHVLSKKKIYRNLKLRSGPELLNTTKYIFFNLQIIKINGR